MFVSLDLEIVEHYRGMSKNGTELISLLSPLDKHSSACGLVDDAPKDSQSITKNPGLSKMTMVTDDTSLSSHCKVNGIKSSGLGLSDKTSVTVINEDYCNNNVDTNGNSVTKQKSLLHFKSATNTESDKFQKAEPHLSVVEKTAEGARYGGKIKLINFSEKEKEEKKEKQKNKIKIDLDVEFSRRQQTNISEKPPYLKPTRNCIEELLQEDEVDDQSKEVHKKKEYDGLEMLRVDEKDTLQNDKKNNVLPNQECCIEKVGFNENEPDYILKERQEADEAERKLLEIAKQGKQNKGSGNVLKRWSSCNLLDCHPKGSDYSVLVGEDDQIGQEYYHEEYDHPVEEERALIYKTEHAFRQFILQHKAVRNVHSNTYKNSKPSKFFNISIHANEEYLITRNDKEFQTLKLELQSAKTRADKAQNEIKYLDKTGRCDEIYDVEQKYHEACLNISKLKKRMMQIQKESRTSFRETRRYSSSENCSSAWQISGQKIQPPVNTDEYNDEGDCVPEGIIQRRLKLFQADITSKIGKEIQ